MGLLFGVMRILHINGNSTVLQIKTSECALYFYLFIHSFFLLAALEFELWASCLLGRCTIS
jgi:hypothetical protein